eukprot:5804682-Prymnesium_polylepis.1
MLSFFVRGFIFNWVCAYPYVRLSLDSHACTCDVESPVRAHTARDPEPSQDGTTNGRSKY